MNENRKIVLASKSPRRKKLLQDLKLKFTVCPSNFEEKNTKLPPKEIALHNAKGKARDVAKKYKNAIIIGVDTIVFARGKILGKPKNPKEALQILRTLSGTTHQVISGICVIDMGKNKELSATETTKIVMDTLSNEEMKAYLASGEGSDKAGGYAIQGFGSLFIKKIDGDYFNVVGLPIYRLYQIFKKLGMKLPLTGLKK